MCIRDSYSALITVGDVVTTTVIAGNRFPNVAVGDLMTQRQPYLEAKRAVEHVWNPGQTLRVKNVGDGDLSFDLWEACLQALRTMGTTDTFVHVTEGEEDLAVIPVVLFAPLRSIVLYGQPPRTDAGEGKGGIVLLHVTPQLKRRIHTLLRNMTLDVDVTLDDTKVN